MKVFRLLILPKEKRDTMPTMTQSGNLERLIGKNLKKSEQVDNQKEQQQKEREMEIRDR